MVSAAVRTRSPTSATLSASRTSSRADWSRAIAWHLSPCSLAGSRRDSRGGLFSVLRHAVEAWSYTTGGDATLDAYNRVMPVGERRLVRGAPRPVATGGGQSVRRAVAASSESTHRRTCRVNGGSGWGGGSTWRAAAAISTRNRSTAA